MPVVVHNLYRHAAASRKNPRTPGAIFLSLTCRFIYTRTCSTHSYTKVSIGGLIAAGIIQRTTHLQGSQPAGSNELMLDAHVEWRSFRLMYNNGNPQTYFGNNPVFIF